MTEKEKKRARNQKILALAKSGITPKEIAPLFNLSKSAIGVILQDFNYGYQVRLKDQGKKEVQIIKKHVARMERPIKLSLYDSFEADRAWAEAYRRGF